MTKACCLVFIILFTLVGCEITTLKEADCGWVGMTEEDCLGKGCIWLEGFEGPWCQFSDSPFIPGGLPTINLSDDQLVIIKYSVMMVVVLCGFVLLEDFALFKVQADTIITITLFMISWITRFHNLEHPKEVTFDEYYFGYFANAYCNQLHIFDIHPPLAKLTHYLVAVYLGHSCTFDFHGKEGLEVYNDLSEYFYMRQVSAFFGTLIVPLGYLLLRRLDFSRATSIVFATMILCDTLLLSETRLILTDSQLFFYIVFSVYCAYQLWYTKDNTWQRTFWTILAGIACGCAFCVKFTALSTLGWIVLISLVAYYPHLDPVPIKNCILAMVIGLIVFAIPFYFHFALGIHSGELAWNIDIDHQKLLIGNEHYDPNAEWPNFFSHLIYLIKRMLEQNAASLGAHPYASYWFEWIVAKGALLSYAEHFNDADWHGHVFLVSNPFICYPILFAIFIFILSSLVIIRFRVYYPLSKQALLYVLHGWMFFLGWISNLVPYALVARTTYSYHYLPGQFYGMLILALVIEFIPKLYFGLFPPEIGPKFLSRFRKVVSILCIIGLVWSYYYCSVFSYGYGLTQNEWLSRKWLVVPQ